MHAPRASSWQGVDSAGARPACPVPHVARGHVLCVLLYFFSSRRRHTRYISVTGVQTCALPICIDQGNRVARKTSKVRSQVQTSDDKDKLRHSENRSEERRVGKEGRSRWSP